MGDLGLNTSNPFQLVIILVGRHSADRALTMATALIPTMMLGNKVGDMRHVPDQCVCPCQTVDRCGQVSVDRVLPLCLRPE